MALEDEGSMNSGYQASAIASGIFRADVAVSANFHHQQLALHLVLARPITAARLQDKFSIRTMVSLNGLCEKVTVTVALQPVVAIAQQSELR
eukprot:3596075-Amphidinium_carterae.1